MTDVNQYLYTIQPTRMEMLTEGSTPEEAEIVSAHYEYLKELLEQEILILAGRTLNADDTTFGIVIINVDSEVKANEIMGNDPAVVNGVMNASLYPYRVALMAKG